MRPHGIYQFSFWKQHVNTKHVWSTTPPPLSCEHGGQAQLSWEIRAGPALTIPAALRQRSNPPCSFGLPNIFLSLWPRRACEASSEGHRHPTPELKDHFFQEWFVYLFAICFWEETPEGEQFVNPDRSSNQSQHIYGKVQQCHRGKQWEDLLLLGLLTFHWELWGLSQISRPTCLPTTQSLPEPGEEAHHPHWPPTVWE